jgi:hypothetical protein
MTLKELEIGKSKKTVKGVDIENILIYRNLMRKILNKNYTWRIV